MNISELLKTLKIDINSMTMSEKLLGGVSAALLSMMMVFIILVLIAFIIKIINRDKKTISSNNQSLLSVDEAKFIDNEENIYDSELIAVITAAIIASNDKEIIVRRIKRTNNKVSDWEKAPHI